MRLSRPRLVGQEHWPAELAFLAGVAFAIVVGALFAIPALRTRGVNLAVVTLGLGFAVQQVVFSNQYFTGDFGSVTTIGRISVFGWDVSAADHPDRYLVVCLGVFVLAALMVANLRRSGFGTTAHRGAEQRARRGLARDQRVRRQALRVQRRCGDRVVRRHPARVQGLDGRLHAATTRSSRSTRSATRSPAASAGCSARCSAATSRPGDSGSIPLDWIDLGSWIITIGGVTLILIVILNPNGIASVVLNDERGIGKLRLRLRRTPAREELVDVAPSEVTPATLEIEDLTVRFGAVVAVDDVSFQRRAARGRRADRSERRGEDDHRRRPHRLHQADCGPRSSSTARR